MEGEQQEMAPRNRRFADLAGTGTKDDPMFMLGQMDWRIRGLEDSQKTQTETLRIIASDVSTIKNRDAIQETVKTTTVAIRSEQRKKIMTAANGIYLLLVLLVSIIGAYGTVKAIPQSAAAPSTAH